jgi:hypothetical protein
MTTNDSINPTNTRRPEVETEGFLTERSYIFEIKVYGGTSRFSLSYEALGLNEDQAKEFKRQGVGPNYIHIYENQKKALSRLNHFKSKIQSVMLRWDPFWFCHEKTLPLVQERIRDLEQEHAKLLKDLEDNYEEGKKHFKHRLANVLISLNLKPSKVTEVLKANVSRFPSLEDMKQDFRYVINGPIVIPSIQEQAKIDAVLAETASSIEVAKLAKEMSDKYRQQVKESLDLALVSTRQEIQTTLKEVLHGVLTLEPGASINPYLKKISEIIEKAEHVQHFESDLGGLISQLNLIGSKLSDKETPVPPNELKTLFEQARALSSRTVPGSGYLDQAAGSILF